MALTLRNVKGSALTHTEMDDNLTYLETEAQNVAEHDNAEHSTNYEPEFAKNTAFNKAFGTSADTVCEGNDARLSDAREPTTHDSSKHSDMNVGTWAAGQLLIYDATNSELVNAALTAGTGLSVTEADGSITVENTDTGSSAISSHETTYDHTTYIPDAPADNNIYGRKNNSWVKVDAAGYTSPVVSTGTATDVGGTSFVVPVTLESFGSIDTSYMMVAVEYKEASAGTWTEIGAVNRTTTGTENITVDGLSTVTGYDYRGVAYNSFNPDSQRETGSEKQVTTLGVYVEQPTLSVDGAGTNEVPKNPTLSGSAFNVVDDPGDSSHDKSDFKCTRTSDSTVVWSSLDDASNLTSITMDYDLATSTEYLFEMRYHDATYGWSDWDSVTATTASEFFDSGPGPTTLDYDSTTDTGYYGLVDSGDFISGDDLCSDIGLSAGNSQHSDTPWMKFYVGPAADCNAFVRRGETAQAYVAFIPQKPIRYDLSWDHIYNAGAVFGTGDNGPTGAGDSWGSGNVTQDASITVDGNEFRIRLLIGAEANPTVDENGTGSEWNELIYRIHSDQPDGKSNWATMSNADIIVASGDGRRTWCQETRSSDNGNRVFLGRYGLDCFETGTSSASFAGTGFRPVLELVQT